MTIRLPVSYLFKSNFIEIKCHVPKDVASAQHSLDIAIGWFADPIYLGKYPEYMREMLGDRLPDFTEEEWSVVKDSSDFYGQNTYVSLIPIPHIVG